MDKVDALVKAKDAAGINALIDQNMEDVTKGKAILNHLATKIDDISSKNCIIICEHVISKIKGEG